MTHDKWAIWTEQYKTMQYSNKNSYQINPEHQHNLNQTKPRYWVKKQNIKDGEEKQNYVKRIKYNEMKWSKKVIKIEGMDG